MHVDSPATVIQTAEHRGVYSIGFQSIAAKALAPKFWISGLGFTWGPFMTATAKSVVAGSFKPAMVREGLGQMMAVAPFRPRSARGNAGPGHGRRREGLKRLQPVRRPGDR
jgi:hypothetical protein